MSTEQRAANHVANDLEPIEYQENGNIAVSNADSKNKFIILHIFKRSERRPCTTLCWTLPVPSRGFVFIKTPRLLPKVWSTCQQKQNSKQHSNPLTIGARSPRARKVDGILCISITRQRFSHARGGVNETRRNTNAYASLRVTTGFQQRTLILQRKQEASSLAFPDEQSSYIFVL